MKLNKTNREEIISAAIRAAFKARDAAYEKQRTILADSLYQHTYGEAGAIAKKLPREWQTRQDSYRIVCDGFQDWRGGAGADNNLKLSTSQPFPPYTAEIKVNKEHAFYKDAQAIVREDTVITLAKEELRTKLHALVHSVSTTEKLRDAWYAAFELIATEFIEGLTR